MEIQVRFLENLRLEASFDDFSITTDQPIRYKGDGSAPSPFDYFLASSALCAAYFVKVYCKARNIPAEDIRLSQNNIIDPENRYNQKFQIRVELPADLSEHHRTGILRSIERCTVKKVIQQTPEFCIETVDVLGSDSGLMAMAAPDPSQKTNILGKDLPLEETISTMTEVLETLGINVEIASWRNLVPNVWSVHVRDATSPLCFTNGKGASKDSALCSALGEYMERISCNYFYNDHFLGEDIASQDFVHYPDEKWFIPGEDDAIPEGLMDAHLLDIYNPDQELKSFHLIDTNSGRSDRGICALPFIRHSDKQTVYIPANLIGNLFVSNGMSAGNTITEARVQCLSEIFERAVKNRIIAEEIVLPDVPKSVLNRFPGIMAGIKELEDKGYPVVVKDASLGGRFPVMCVTLMNPRNGGVFASFGSHPKFEVALERSLTELLQGRSFESLNDVLPPTFSREAITEPNNLVEHFIDSTGVISWKFFSAKHDYEFVDWNIPGDTASEQEYLMGILEKLEKEVYIADYTDLGANACRILVPNYSEIYPVEDLIWDNNNKALDFRADILNIHSLDDSSLTDLLERFELYEMDEYTNVAELIGIEFDENTVWGQLNVGELKLMICLALKRYEDAKELTTGFFTFNDNTVARRLFYHAMNAALDITLDPDLDMADYQTNMTRLYGQEVVDDVISCIEGSIKFHGLTPTSMKLECLDRHQRLIDSYKKLHNMRARAYQDRQG